MRAGEVLIQSNQRVHADPKDVITLACTFHWESETTKKPTTFGSMWQERHGPNDWFIGTANGWPASANRSRCKLASTVMSSARTQTRTDKPVFMFSKA